MENSNCPPNCANCSEEERPGETPEVDEWDEDDDSDRI